MGELTDDVLDGSTCEFCGVYFERAHGFPVLCGDCWRGASAADRGAHARASEKEL